MVTRMADGSAGDANYATIGAAYTHYRRPDPRSWTPRPAAYPSTTELADGLGGVVTIEKVPVPLDCTDGFNEAYYGRPEALMDPLARLSCSAWSFVGAEATDRFVSDLGRDLADGTWDRRFGHLRVQPTFDGSLALVISER